MLRLFICYWETCIIHGDYRFYYLIYNYCFILCFFSFLIEREKKYALFFRFLRFCVLFFPAAYRYGIGRDYFSYLRMYDNSEPTEPFFSLLIQILHFLEKPNKVFIIMSSFINCFIIAFFFKNKEMAWFIAFFHILICYINSYNIIRQAFATSLLTVSFQQLIDRKKMRSLIFLVLAFSAHIASIIAIPLWILLNKKTRLLTR